MVSFPLRKPLNLALHRKSVKKIPWVYKLLCDWHWQQTLMSNKTKHTKLLLFFSFEAAGLFGISFTSKMSGKVLHRDVYKWCRLIRTDTHWLLESNNHRSLITEISFTGLLKKIHVTRKNIIYSLRLIYCLKFEFLRRWSRFVSTLKLPTGFQGTQHYLTDIS